MLSSTEMVLFGSDKAPNPLYVPALAFLQPILGPTIGAGNLLLVGIVVVLVSLLLRYRHSSTLERQQIKWLALAAAVYGAAFPIWGLAFVLSFVNVWRVIFYGIVSLFPVLAIGIAVLR